MDHESSDIDKHYLDDENEDDGGVEDNYFNNIPNFNFYKSQVVSQISVFIITAVDVFQIVFN